MAEGQDHMTRRWEFDALRGLMLVLMMATHLPTRFAAPLGQPLGYVSAAEGFVLLSGFMAGMVYTRQARRQGVGGLRDALWSRALKVYVCQAGLLVFLLTVVSVLGAVLGQAAINDLVAFHRERPMAALVCGLLLLYTPALLDILPMYVLFLLASPFVLRWGLQRGWAWVLGASLLLWLATQFGLSRALYDAVAAGGVLPVPYEQTGSFEMLAWQWLWVLGLWLGSELAEGRPGGAPAAQPLRFPPWLVRTAWAVALLGLVWRQWQGQLPFPDGIALAESTRASLNLLFDKWRLGPLRLLNLLALMVLLMHHAPQLLRALPRLPALETLGAASLTVFSAHLVLVLLALALLGAADELRPWSWDLALLSGGLVALWGVAKLEAWLDQGGLRALPPWPKPPPAPPRRPA